jgi:hypothetical protein
MFVPTWVIVFAAGYLATRALVEVIILFMERPTSTKRNQ